MYWTDTSTISGILVFYQLDLECVAEGLRSSGKHHATSGGADILNVEIMPIGKGLDLIQVGGAGSIGGI